MAVLDDAVPARPVLELRSWFGRSLVFGPLSGLLLSMGFNHGYPGRSALFAVPVLLGVYVLYARFVGGSGYWPWPESFARSAAVLVGGSVLFMLPRFLTLAASGDFWQTSVLLRLLICCAPYPLVALLVGPRSGGGLTWTACAGLAVIAVLWPAVLAGGRVLTARQIRHDLGEPASMLLTIDPPALYAPHGYIRRGPTLWLAYDSGIGPQKIDMSTDYNPDDLDMFVLSVDATSPCAAIRPIEDAIGIDFQTGPCTHPSANLWTIADAPEPDATIDIERYGDAYVALAVDANSTHPVPPSALPGLFATIHRVSDAELVQVGQR